MVGGVALTAERGDILLALTLGPDCCSLGAGGILRLGERLEVGSMCLLHLGWSAGLGSYNGLGPRFT